MYEVFDSFLLHDTWSSDHVLDNARFFRAPSTVVRDQDFNPDKMGEYFEEKHPEGYDNAISKLRSKAWAVREYLQATSE